MKNLIFGLILVLAGSIVCQPETAFGQDNLKLVKSNPPKLVRHIKLKKNDTKNERKKMKLRRKIDMSKVPRVISIRPAN